MKVIRTARENMAEINPELQQISDQSAIADDMSRKEAPTRLDAALAYAKMGWHVIPLHTPTGKSGQCSCGRAECGNSIGKHPRVKDWPNNASTEANTIKKWWDKWPNANIGIATGAKSGIVVLDVDGPEGAATLKKLQQEH